MSDVKTVLDRIEHLKTKHTELQTEMATMRPDLEKGTADPGKLERAKNLMRGLDRVKEELESANREYEEHLLKAYENGEFDGGLETGDGSRQLSGWSTKGSGLTPGAGTLGAEVARSGFNLKARPSVEFKAMDALKSTFLTSTQWGRSTPTFVPMGQDRRFMYRFLPTENAAGKLSVEDWTQTARDLTGTVERAIDATTTKADLDVTITLTTASMKQHAVTIDEVPNAILENIPRLTQFLQGEATFQVQKSIDSHVYAQIVAGTPPFGNTGANLIEKVRAAISSMRAEGANPTLLVVNPSDATTLDTYQTADGAFLADTSRTNVQSPLWGLQVVERIGAGTEPPYLIDPQMLGLLYMGVMRFDADPYTNFKKNLTTLRVEVEALFHVRNAKGARRIAAS